MARNVQAYPLWGRARLAQVAGSSGSRAAVQSNVGELQTPGGPTTTRIPARERVAPWLTLSVARGNAVQILGLVGATALAWRAGREGERGTRWMVASRLLAYFSEHAFSHWLVGRAVGIRFTGYGLHGTSHPLSYPPGVRFLFSRLPLLSARVDPHSLRAASPAARAAMYAAGTIGTVIPSVVIPGYCWRRGVRGARGFFIGTNLWSVPLLLSESLRPGGDLRRAWRALRSRAR